MAPKKTKNADRNRAASDRARAKWEREAAKESRNDAGGFGGSRGGSTYGPRPTGRTTLDGSVGRGGRSANESGGRPPGRSGYNQEPAARPSPMGRSLGEMFGEIQRKRASGSAFGRMGQVTSGLGGIVPGMGGLNGTMDSLLESISANFPQAPQAPSGINPTLVDIAATLAPFAAARQSANDQAALNRGTINTLATQGMEDNRDVQQAEQARLGTMAQLLQTRQKQNMSGATADGAASLRDLAAQGVDPGQQAAMQSQIDTQRRDAGNASQGALDMVANQKSTEGIEAKRADRQVQASQADATGQLNANLFEALMGLNSQEQKARTDAEQFNAQSQQQASESAFAGQQQQYDANMQRMQDQMALPGALGEAASSIGAYGFPKRDQVMNTIQSSMNVSSADGVGFGLQQALMASDNPEDAFEGVVNHVAAVNAKRKKNDAAAITPDMGRLRRLVSDYYAQDGTMEQDKYQQLKRLFGGLGGI